MGIKRKIVSVALCLIMMLSCINVNVIDAKAQDSITIDVTGLASGSESSHDCNKYLTNKYDKNQHWQECSVCGKVVGNKSKHNLKKTDYNYGYASCYASNTYTVYCSDNCGYSYVTSDTHGNLSGIRQAPEQWIHYRQCTSCGGWAWDERCRKTDGSIITCDNLGTCAICGYTYTKASFKHYINSNDGKCGICGKQIVSVEYSDITYNSDKSIAIFTLRLKGNNVTFSTNVNDYKKYWSNGEIVKLDSSISGNSNNIAITYKITQNQNLQSIYNFRPYVNFGYGNEIACFSPAKGGINIKPENDAPVISNIAQKNLSTSNNWATQKQITITGTENHCSTVYLTMKDNDGNIYLNNATTSVNNKNWTYTFIPDIEADTNGKTFTITAMDSIGNISTKTFTVYKTDKKAPTITSLSSTSTEWSKSKNFTAQATDTGVGGVKIAFNNTNSYIIANQTLATFSQKYLLTGDVYGSTKAAVYYKDALGNETTQFIIISNIDNTAPTITNTKITYDKIVTIEVTANDNKDFGGDVGIKEGSGIAGYALSESTTAPDTFQESNVLEVPKTGDYYLYVKDNVGNVQSKHIGTIKTECEINTSYTGIGSISNSSKVDYTENTSVFIVPAEGFDLATLKIDGVTVTPVRKYDFISVEKDHTVEATFSITQNKKMELIQKGYSWIDLKL